MYSLIASAINHPDAINPYQGLFNHRIIRALSETGVDLSAVSPRPFAPPVGPYSAYASLPEAERWDGYTVHHPRFWYLLPKRLLYAVSGDSYAKRVPPYLERTFDPPDVVHACHIYPDGYGTLPYAREHDLPLFVVAHGALLNGFEDLPPGVAGRVRETLAAAEGVLCVSDALAERARSLVDASKVATVPIGADPGKFPLGERARLRSERGLDPEETLVLFVGQFSDRKGVPELLELLSTRTFPGVTFAFAGHGGDRETDLRRAVADREDATVHAGLPSERLREWFAAADLLVLPSHAEGRPTVVYEAMASETAVLASAVGGVPEQVADSEAGRLLEPGDVTALGDALADLSADPDRLRKMGAAGRRRLEANDWTWSGHARRVSEIHREALR
ncbi:glycosyltransferase [Natronomonas marina]|uniref:glycosyltransferase n=1 Tax=Natronomonas marina TaxID=2961939 RepID=UPI0020C998A5|nr:glycosyltransferase [Natronomonas marina]